MKAREFVIPTEPTMADPAWVIACWDHKGVRYSDYPEIERVITQCKADQARAAGYSQALVHLCERFGVKNIPALYKLADERKAGQREEAD